MHGIAKRRIGWLAQIGHLLRRLGLSQTGRPRYVTSSPQPQHAVDILPGQWRSRLPGPLAGVKAGELALFEDDRIRWFVESIGGVAGLTVLELGPLEGGHSYMLEQYGAASITAIEANSQAYLKCLIVKELLELKRVNFLCGDFVAYLREAPEPTFDLCLASGVLYHMQNPAELIALIARRQVRYLFLWTHYYDGPLIAANPALARKHSGQVRAGYEGFEHTLYRYEYQAGRFMPGFSGAGAAYSHWLSRDDLIRCLEYFGFGNFQIGFDEPDHKHGPAFALIASRARS